MGKSDKKIREDEMWCPECGTPIKKGFFTCSNCRLKVKMTRDISGKKDKKPIPPPKAKTKEKSKKENMPSKKEVKPPDKDTGALPDKNPLKKSGHPRYWNF